MNSILYPKKFRQLVTMQKRRFLYIDSVGYGFAANYSLGEICEYWTLSDLLNVGTNGQRLIVWLQVSNVGEVYECRNIERFTIERIK